MPKLLAKKCQSCKTTMLVEIRDSKIGNTKELVCIKGCFLLLASQHLKRNHLHHRVEQGMDGLWHWIGSIQNFVYCGCCGRLRYIKTFKEVKI
jgi:hypothetical protein